MKSQKFHRSVGLFMLLPLICWAVTGTIFFIKPGYQGAYEMLNVKTYPIDKSFTIPSNSNWQEVRLVKTILGFHLLVKSNEKTIHLNASTLEPRAKPSSEELALLIDDAIAHNKARYGEIEQWVDNKAMTSTGVRISLNWETLKLRQKGEDTDLINLIYKIHYLQWTPWSIVNQVLGIVGLFFLVTLSILGMRLFLLARKQRV
ncbi:PepSY domain-containing protein [Pleionea sediminis]|uniref:PepSY domain-containing protein n=1 Tax=Pleionea sediminis TaxID=2569479 RepID=UPI0011858575|nr:PepSY domain-containing protein [Pleionea sediminis]